MNTIESKILIIGGGLTGLALAYFLKKKNLNAIVIEARDRFGGRIFTKYAPNIAAQDMGATWLGNQHTSLIQLLKELKIDVFEQILGDRALFEPISTSPPQVVNLPPNTDPSFRIKGGSSSLIKALVDKLDSKHLYHSQLVQSIEKNKDGISLKTEELNFKGSILISTLPPNLLVNSIKISPALPSSLTDIAKSTHTWMGESIKVGLSYAQPFWRMKNLSGTIFSNVGPISEMYDHSNFEDTYFALKGFMNGSYFSVTKEERRALVLKQLEKYFGAQVRDFLSYEEGVWRKEPFTFSDYPHHILPHQNNGHLVFQKPYLGGSLFIAGTETAQNFPGYMEGAIRSAIFIDEQISGL